VAALFADETPPDPGTVCRPDPDIERPAWWDRVPDPARGETSLEAQFAGPVVGLRASDAYAEFRAVPDDDESVFERYRDALVAAGFVAEDGDATYEPGMPVFFEVDGEYLGLYIVGEDELADGLGSALGGLVPEGSVLVVLYFYAQ